MTIKSTVNRVVDRIDLAIFRARYALAKWRTDRRRDVSRWWFTTVGIVALLAVVSCGPSTSDVVARQHALFAECTTNWRRIEAMDAPAEERLRLYEAEGQRCREAGLAICEPGDTCGEFHR